VRIPTRKAIANLAIAFLLVWLCSFATSQVTLGNVIIADNLEKKVKAMTDPITASVLVGLAAQKFVEAGAGELAKKFTTEAIAKLYELWQQIKGKLQGKSPKVDEALGKLESGDRSAIDTIIKNLDVALDDDETYAALLQKLAQDIKAGQIRQVGLDGIEAKRVEADIVQDAKGDRVEQIGAKDVKATEDAVFNINQSIK
jgi:hypothetical protein